MKRREFLQQAHTFRPDKHKIGGWYLSEKLDGTRCLWDGGVSRGQPTTNVPWAGVINPRTGEPKGKVKKIATGLWSRNGNPIVAPDDFLDRLPPFPCDGELWAGRGNFQICRSICGRDEPDERFNEVMKFAVFSSPPIQQLFQSGLIKNTNMLNQLDWDQIQKFILKNKPKEFQAAPQGSTLEQEIFALRVWDGWDDDIFILKQQVLPPDDQRALDAVYEAMEKLLDQGAEGMVVRDPNAVWMPKRIYGCLKFKPWEDDEGIVVGFTSGRETNKGSKLLGMIGSLILDYKGQRLEIAGLTNDERQFNTTDDILYATRFPGEDMPASTQGLKFKIGDKVTFKYRELSDDGIPKEARYWRQRGEE